LLFKIKACVPGRRFIPGVLPSSLRLKQSLFKFDPIKFILLTSLALLLLKRQKRFEQALPGPKGESQGWLS